MQTPGMTTPASTAEFEERRPLLFGLAYRMLGSAEEAEDVVQDAFLRWSATDREVIAHPTAWLTKVVTNLCLNRLTAARVQRERYVGPWLPEPVLTADGALGPLETVEQRDLVSFAVLVLLERLTPVERAVFVLREAFGYSHREIAQILEISEANCRQLHYRARRHLAQNTPRFKADHRQRRRLLETFLTAAREGDMASLEAMLTQDVVSWSDGGGEVGMALRPIRGRDRVARYFIGGIRRLVTYPRFHQVEVAYAEVNGEPAALYWLDGQLAGVVVPDITDELISGLRIVANPKKLTFLAGQLARLSHSRQATGSSPVR